MKRFFIGVLLFMLLLLALGGCETKPVRFQSVDTAMGTIISQQLYSVGQDPTDGVIDLLRELERNTLSRRLESAEVFQINAHAGEGGIPLTDKMGKILTDCLDVWEKSQGAFDVTICPLTELWNIDAWAAGELSGSYEIPGPEAIAHARSLCGSDKLILRMSENHTTELTLLPGMRIDLGAVGKGIAMDCLRDCLEKQDAIRAAVITVGGSVLTYGEKPDRTPWRISVTDPFDPSKACGVLTLRGSWCVSTSGDYERYVEIDGRRMHHIIDPKTGAPAQSDVRGVTILSRDGFLSDALSTACFVLGSEKGLTLAGIYGAEALFVLSDGTLVMTDGMAEYFEEK